MTQQWLRVAAAYLISCALVSCNADRSMTTDVTPCDGPLTITVTSGTTPTFDWAPSCGVNRFDVYPATPQPGVVNGGWSVNSATGLFKPPITYGVPPNGADRGEAGKPLVPGTTYTVSASRAAYEAIIASHGSATFTP